MASSYRTFAVVGLGRMGTSIAELFLASKQDLSIILIARSESEESKRLCTLGAELRTVDYSNSHSVQTALNGVDVVISTLGFFGLANQEILAGASRDAGVKLFVPSEYGARSDQVTDPAFSVKEQFRQKLVSLGVPYCVFYTGFWADFDLRPICLKEWFGIDIDGGIIHKWMPWDVLLSFTTQTDIARFVVHVLTTLPPAELQNRTFRVEAGRQTWTSLVMSFLSSKEVSTAGKYKDLNAIKFIGHTPAELDEELTKNPGDIGKRLLRTAGQGLFCVTQNGIGELDNNVWPEWNPEPSLSVMKRLFDAPRETSVL